MEPPQVSSPAIIRSPANNSHNKQLVLFLEEFYLQAPLDNIEDMSYLVIEFAAKDSGSVLAWMKFILDKSVLNSEPALLPIYAGPRDSTDEVYGIIDMEIAISRR